MTLTKATIGTVLLAALALAPAAADVVELTDGSRLLGTIVRMQDGNGKSPERNAQKYKT